MFSETLRNSNQVEFSGNIDKVVLFKEKDKFIIRKVATGRTGIGYFIGFTVFMVIISVFAESILVPALCLVFLLSLVYFIFSVYESEIDFARGSVTLSKKLFNIRLYHTTVPFYSILDWKIRDGEIGYNVLIKTGDALGLFNRLKDEKLICRIHKYEEAFDFINYIKEFIKPQ